MWFQVSDAEGMPVKLCPTCVTSLESAFQVYVLAVKAQSSLRALLDGKLKVFSVYKINLTDLYTSF